MNLVILSAWIFFILKEFSVDAKYDKFCWTPTINQPHIISFILYVWLAWDM